MMQRLVLIFLSSLLASLSYGQTNTFPSAGNVGIGTTSPSEKLTVVGNIHAAGIGSKIFFNRNDGVANVGGVGWHTDGFFYVGGHPIFGTGASSSVRVRGFGADLSLGTATAGDVILIKPSGLVGIGTNGPSEKLTVAGNIHIAGNGNRVIFNRNDGTSGVGGIGWHTDGTFYLGGHPSYGPGAGSNVRVWGFGQDLLLGTNSGGDAIAIKPNGSVGIGTNMPGSTYKLAVEGTIGARKIVVKQTSWADYVFQPDYMLPSLAMVKVFIEQHKHLPHVPSAQEVAKNGLDLGDNQATLLRKIEELTLYAIDADKRLNEQQALITELKEIVEGLKGQRKAR